MTISRLFPWRMTRIWSAHHRILASYHDPYPNCLNSNSQGSPTCAPCSAPLLSSQRACACLSSSSTIPAARHYRRHKQATDTGVTNRRRKYHFGYFRPRATEPQPQGHRETQTAPQSRCDNHCDSYRVGGGHRGTSFGSLLNPTAAPCPPHMGCGSSMAVAPQSYRSTATSPVLHARSPPPAPHKHPHY